MRNESGCRHGCADSEKKLQSVPRLTRSRFAVDPKTKVRNTYQRERRRRVDTIVDGLHEILNGENAARDNDNHGSEN